MKNAKKETYVVECLGRKTIIKAYDAFMAMTWMVEQQSDIILKRYLDVGEEIDIWIWKLPEEREGEEKFGVQKIDGTLHIHEH